MDLKGLKGSKNFVNLKENLSCIWDYLKSIILNVGLDYSDLVENEQMFSCCISVCKLVKSLLVILLVKISQCTYMQFALRNKTH